MVIALLCRCVFCFCFRISIKFRFFLFFALRRPPSTMHVSGCDGWMPVPLELDAELTAELSNAVFEFRPTAGGATLVVVSLPATGNGILVCELTPNQLAAALAARRIAAAPKAKATPKGKGKGRSRSPRRYLVGCRCFVFTFFTCVFDY